MSDESTSAKPKTTKKAKPKAKAKSSNVDTVFDLAMQGMLVVQIGLAVTAFLFEIDFASDNDIAGTFLLATFLSYVAILAIVYALSLQIGDDKKSPITRIFAFIYYIVILGVLYIATSDPAGGIVGALTGGA